MIYIKHKNMRDVCAGVMNQRGDRFEVVWVNLLGTYQHPDPFVVGNPARETLKISKDEFLSNWEVKASAKDFKRK